MKKNKIYADEFVSKFMEGSLQHLKYIQTPIKIFALKDIAPYLRTPIPPIFFGYNLLIHLTKGYFQHQIESTQFLVKAPAVIIANYGHISAISDVDKNAEGHCVLIKEQAMTSILRDQETLNIFNIAPLLNLNLEESRDLDSMLQLLYKEIYDQNPYQSYYESIFKTILLKIIKLSDANTTLQRNQEIAIAFKQLVYLDFFKEKSVTYYADKLSVSTNYLNRCVSGVFNKSAKQVILEVAIMHSQLLLVETNKPIATIAYELEFEDPSYFTRLFKKLVGITPKEYRNRTM
ncbi:helix-turn-helix domain-containing protein [Sphingobacterium cavernae]|uniref:helix-turn-helix domain-containing protein n=1 Tax=Sphingobacterium cavernae TaxID=2592657 RepID=UPI00123010E5|nr:helix-turn-helix domain-containing protein [Sphingobacterium cavernae]